MARDFAYADTSAQLGEPEIWHQNKSAVTRSYEIMGFQSCVELGKEAFVTTDVTANALTVEFLARLNRDRFSQAIKWVQARYAT